MSSRKLSSLGGAVSCAALMLSAVAVAHDLGPVAGPVPTYRVAKGTETATLYASGEQVKTDWTQIWRPICGSEGEVSSADVMTMAINHDAIMTATPAEELVIVDTLGEGGVAGAGLNLVFVLGSGVPASAVSAISAVETWLEAQFADPITVTINISFQAMSPGVLGSTGSFWTTSSYTSARNGLVNGMDSNDSLQSWLPTGSTCPVRYNGSASSITNESTVWWTRANYRAAVGSVTGTAASMTFNTNFSWDYDPANGVSGYSFRDVLAHETGHALGFVSAVDWGSSTTDMTSLDLFRFPLADGSSDYNPDTLAEFQSKPRLVDYNTPNDSHNSDLITVEYRMSDGTPYQGSHFREQSPNIGVMDPAFSFGQTFYPNYLKASDLEMFDVIGWNR